MNKPNRPLVILHGWDDNSYSFRKLTRLLQQQGWEPLTIKLADYITMDDEVTFMDLAYAMEKAWLSKKLPNSAGSVDVIAHSTGALVTRLWLQQFYQPETAPIKHVVFLAPAHFGSHLAHRGRAFYGRVLKIFSGRRLLEVGAKLLYGLELASPFTWGLALADRFNADNFYQPGRILCTNLIGNTGYSGVAAAGNDLGSDGTVRIANANLDCARLVADFSQDPLNPKFSLCESDGMTAFGVLDGENHSTIAAKGGGFKNSATLYYIKRALTVRDEDFPAWCAELAEHTAQTMRLYQHDSYKQGYQSIVCHVSDQFGFAVTDYFLEFFGVGQVKGKIAKSFHGEWLRTVHNFSADPSYRSFYFNCTQLYQHYFAKPFDLAISLVATPAIQEHGLVGYRTFTDKDIGEVVIERDQLPDLIKENRTLLLDIKLRREQGKQLFTIT